jgi:lysophospholipase L1-like esterase
MFPCRSKMARLFGRALIAPAVLGLLCGPMIAGANHAPAVAAEISCAAGFEHHKVHRPSSVFEERVAQFDRNETEHPPGDGGVIFTGSSSIERWTNLEAHLSRFSVRNRGISGSTLADTIHFLDRIVTHSPKVVVLYGLENDLNAGLSREEVLGQLTKLIDGIHERAPKAKILLVSVKPSPARICEMGVQKQVNDAMKAMADAAPEQLTFLDLVPDMVDEKGLPRRELYADDALHPDQKAYAIWERKFASVIEKLLGHPARR